MYDLLAVFSIYMWPVNTPWWFMASQGSGRALQCHCADFFSMGWGTWSVESDSKVERKLKGRHILTSLWQFAVNPHKSWWYHNISYAPPAMCFAFLIQTCWSVCEAGMPVAGASFILKIKTDEVRGLIFDGSESLCLMNSGSYCWFSTSMRFISLQVTFIFHRFYWHRVAVKSSDIPPNR